MAITGTGHNGFVSFSLEDGVLTLTSAIGRAEIRVGDMTNNYGKVLRFDALRQIAVIDDSSPLRGKSTREVPLGEVNVLESAIVERFDA